MENIDCCWKLEFKTCNYSDKLLDKVLLLNKTSRVKVDINEVKQAICYAKKYHSNQKRQSGEPYYSHPLEVVYMISDYLFRTDILISSILHDTIEDTDLTKEMIAKAFGKVVANQVEDLTRIKQNGYKISSAEMVEMLYKESQSFILCKFYFVHTNKSYLKSPQTIL